MVFINFRASESDMITGVQRLMAVAISDPQVDHPGAITPAANRATRGYFQITVAGKLFAAGDRVDQ
jgi:hypothetical protein